jgi:hypothetical protein
MRQDIYDALPQCRFNLDLNALSAGLPPLVQACADRSHPGSSGLRHLVKKYDQPMSQSYIS